jgi:hypothetical protein
MSLLSDKNKKTYTGNGMSTVFPYDFKILDAAEMQVVVYNSTTETETILTTGYTVDGVGVAGGGNVTLDDAADSPVGTDLILRRNMDFTQGTDWEQNGGFSTDVLEARLDHAYMCLLQLKELTDRMIVQDPTQTTQGQISASALASTLDAIAAASDAQAAQSAAEAARDIAVAAAGSMTLASQAEAEAGVENTKYMSPLRVAQAIAAQAGYTLTFDNADLSTGVLTVTHNRGNAYPSVTVFDNNGKIVLPDEVDSSSINALTVSLVSYGTISGDWTVVVK